MSLTINQIQDISEKVSLIEQDMKDDQLWGTRDGYVTPEQLIDYARKNPHVLEMAIKVAEMLNKQ